MSNVSFLYLYLCAIQKANSCLGLPRVSSKLMCQPWLCAIRLCASQSCLPCLICPRICTWEECFRLLTRKKVRKKWTHLKSPGIRWHSPRGRYLCPISPIRKSTFFCLFVFPIHTKVSHSQLVCLSLGSHSLHSLQRSPGIPARQLP